ncbi:MAG: LysM domain-containing protein [Myxococcota bacterium]
MRPATFPIFLTLFSALVLGSTTGAEPVAPDPTLPTDVGIPATTASRVVLGPWAIDSQGQRGRIHTVTRGDTLWDISATYLGTPWVWPSVWKDNEEIANPHLIVPDDRIWITSGEMRRVTAEEAEVMIAAEEEELAAALDALPAPSQEMEYLPVDDAASHPSPALAVDVSERAAMGFLSPDLVHAATSIVDSPSERTWLAEGDMVYLGVGDGEVSVGDEFTIFRDPEPVYDIRKRRKLGYHVDILGWLKVREVEGASALAEITQSRSALRRGDRIIPRQPVAGRVAVKYTPSGAEGAIVFTPEERTQMADGDHVYLNRGAIHGFEVGSQVEVYLPGARQSERVSGRKILTPDHVVAQMVLVEVQPATSVAYVTESKRALEVGDRIRPTSRKMAAR